MLESQQNTKITKLRRVFPLLVAALVAYLPVVFSSPGKVGADTKTYLYLDPSRLLNQAPSLWDGDVALGTVTHQTIGYLWPMGPFYWLAEALGSPDWLAQRLWLGSILFAAGVGVWFLLKTLDWSGKGVLVAMLAYQLSPYMLHYSARISVVLLPWAALPTMIALTIRAARRGGWRDPAWFALVVVTVGSVNATSLLLVGIAPVLWLVHAALVERSISNSQAAKAALKIAVLSIAVSLWWIVGLWVQSAYSLPVTRYTESYEAVASASTGPEVFRGLGYWFFYGNDKFGQWIQPSIEYTQGVWLHFLSFGLVVFALLGAALVRWRHRAYFVLLIVVGGFVAIAAYPFAEPSFLGSLFKAFTKTDAGLALRSTPRALPMLVLGVAVLLGAIANSTHRRWPQLGNVLAVLIVLAVLLNNPAMWRIRMIEEHLHRDEEIPLYWREAISALDAAEHKGRVMEVPGTDFASYRWGNTVDPITPGLLDRGYVARELVPFGSAPSAALLSAFDRRFQEDTLDLDSLVPIAALMSVDDLVHRADLTYERFRTPRPRLLAEQLARAPNLGAAVGFGEPLPNIAGPSQPLLDEVFLGVDANLKHPPPVTIHAVPNALEAVRLRSLSGGTVLVGDAEGLVDVAGANLLDISKPLWFAADLLADKHLLDTVLAEPSHVVITDGNKQRARRWGTLRENVGEVERIGQVPLVEDRTDNRLPIFPDLAERQEINLHDTRTVAVQQGAFTVQASAYGNPVTYTNDDRAVFAVDGDLETAWEVGAFSEARGEYLQFTFATPTHISEMTFVQPQTEENRRITEVEVRADGVSLGKFALGAASLTKQGQKIEFAETRVRQLHVELTDLDFATQARYAGVSPVGFAEVRFGGSLGTLTETLRTPVALVNELSERLDEHSVSVVLTRERSNPAEPVRDDPEAEMRRLVKVPAGRTWMVTGSARLSANAPESQIDRLLGRTKTPNGLALSARSSGRLAGDLDSAASFAFDAEPRTAWTGEFGPQAGKWLELSTDEEVYVEDLTVDVLADEFHSVPRQIAVWADGENVAQLEVRGAPKQVGSTLRVQHQLDRRLSTLRLVVTAVDERLTQDWYSNAAVAMPIAIAEVNLGSGLHFLAAADVDSGCVELLSINAEPLRARITGLAEDALARRELPLVGCDTTESAANSLQISTQARALGFDFDQLVLRSPRASKAVPSPASVEVLSHDDTSFTLRVPGAAVERWLVLGQSYNRGWSAQIEGIDLPAPILIDGFANAWRLPAANEQIVELRWTPQRYVNWALWLSLGAAIVVMFLAVRPARTRASMQVSAARRRDGPELPQLRPLFGSATTWPVAAVAHPRKAIFGFVVAVTFAALNLPSWHLLAVAVGLLATFSIGSPRPWNRPALLAAFLMGVAALNIMVEQRRFRYPADFSWPQQFDHHHILAVLALILLFVDYLRSLQRPDT